MKSIFKILLAVLIGMCFNAQAFAADKDPEIKFDQTRIQMGTLHEKDGKVKFEFPFVNEGDAPLVIISAQASCGCTQPKFTEDPVQPGKKGVVQVSYNPAGKSGEVSSTITVRTNDKNHKKVILRLSGVVVP